jgi:hypothetical protein
LSAAGAFIADDGTLARGESAARARSLNISRPRGLTPTRYRSTQAHESWRRRHSESARVLQPGPWSNQHRWSNQSKELEGSFETAPKKMPIFCKQGPGRSTLNWAMCAPWRLTERHIAFWSRTKSQQRPRGRAFPLVGALRLERLKVLSRPRRYWRMRYEYPIHWSTRRVLILNTDARDFL